MIKTGRYGKVLYDATGVLPPTVAIASLSKWKLTLKTNKINVTCFQDLNNVYVPSLKDVSGTVSGFYNSTELTLFNAADAPTPGSLELMPNSTEAGFFWSGLSYMDADIDTSVEGAPAVTGTFMAAGPWTLHPGP